MKTIKNTIMASVVFMMGIASADVLTFENIPFGTQAGTTEDPLGIVAATNAEAKANSAISSASNAAEAVATALTKANEADVKATSATNKAETLAMQMSDFKDSVTNAIVSSNGVTVVGSMKGTPKDVGMIAGTNSIVFAIDRDSDDLEPENGQILFSADNIKFDATTASIFIGDSTLASLLGGGGGSGESNKIEVVQTNGVALPIVDKTVNIVIPAPGDANVIETVKVNGTALTPNNKEVDITVPSVDGKLDETNGVAFGDFKVYPMPSGTVGQTHTIITHESMSIGDVEYKENGIAYNGETYEFSSDTNGIARLKDIPTIKTNGVAVAISNKEVDIAIPTVPDISGLATKQEVSELTITTAKVTDLDSYKNPAISAAALVAIDGINNAQDIATIKSTLTNFLHQFVIQNP